MEEPASFISGRSQDLEPAVLGHRYIAAASDYLDLPSPTPLASLELQPRLYRENTAESRVCGLCIDTPPKVTEHKYLTS